ncbi:hypothetical protein CRV24_003148 [Beauveria bassiana]|nr:hypothetical protein CRV24_003148 [Beauveria bassiana]
MRNHASPHTDSSEFLCQVQRSIFCACELPKIDGPWCRRGHHGWRGSETSPHPLHRILETPSPVCGKGTQTAKPRSRADAARCTQPQVADTSRFDGRDSSGRTKVNKYAYQGLKAKYILAGQRKAGT